MPGASISEDYVSRPFTLGQSAGRELIWNVVGTNDENTVYVLLTGVAPLSYNGLALESLGAEPVGGGVWKARAKYVRFENDDEFTFDTGGGTVKITQSLATMGSYARSGETAPDFKGAIGVSEDKVEGCEIVSRKYEFSETHRISDTLITGDYKRLLFDLTGRFNDSPFRGFEAGECLFMGASGTKRGYGDWAITYKFAAEPNVHDLPIGGRLGAYYYDEPGGGVISVDFKLGWDYLWIRYADYEDHTARALVKQPLSAHVERVYEPRDFSLLGIGI